MKGICKHQNKSHLEPEDCVRWLHHLIVCLLIFMGYYKKFVRLYFRHGPFLYCRIFVNLVSGIKYHYCLFFVYFFVCLLALCPAINKTCY